MLKLIVLLEWIEVDVRLRGLTPLLLISSTTLRRKARQQTNQQIVTTFCLRTRSVNSWL